MDAYIWEGEFPNKWFCITFLITTVIDKKYLVYLLELWRSIKHIRSTWRGERGSAAVGRWLWRGEWVKGRGSEEGP